MTDPHETHATDIDLSAYLDAELPVSARRQLALHLAACPRCSQRLADFAALSMGLATLAPQRLGFDLAHVVAGRLPAAAPAPRQPSLPGWHGLLPVGMAGLGASVAMALGIALGTALFGSAAAVPSVSAMRVFDPIPPGGLCLSPQRCYARPADPLGANP